MPDDRSSVRRPLPDGAEDLLEVLAAEAGEEEGGGHPADDELLGYLDGELEPAAQERVRGHLVGCRECAGRALDLDSLHPEGAGAEGGAADLEQAAAWRDLRTALPPGAWEGGVEAGRAHRPRAIQALAAVLALAVVGLGAWVVQLRRDAGDLAVPRSNVPILYLDEPVRTAAGPAPQVADPGPGQPVLLIVTPAAGDPVPEYRAVLATEGGREVWSGGGLRRSEAGTLRLLLPGRLLRPGRYELTLGSDRNGSPGELGRYRFTVRPGGRGATP